MKKLFSSDCGLKGGPVRRLLAPRPYTYKSLPHSRACTHACCTTPSHTSSHTSQHDVLRHAHKVIRVTRTGATGVDRRAPAPLRPAAPCDGRTAPHAWPSRISLPPALHGHQEREAVCTRAAPATHPDVAVAQPSVQHHAARTSQLPHTAVHALRGTSALLAAPNPHPSPYSSPPCGRVTRRFCST